MESLLSVDDGVKAIVDALKASGELDNTLLVFTDDNGFFHGQHRVPSGKVLVYEPSIRVPLLMRGPGVPKNRHLKQMVANIDLAPTFVDLAKAKAGRTMDGRSLLPLLKNPSLQWGRDLLIERGPTGSKRKGTAMGEIADGDNGNQGKTAAPGDQRFVAIRTPSYKYVEYANGEKELYDLAKDPDELNNVAGQTGYAELQGQLSARLATLQSCKGASCRVGPSVSLARTKCKFHVTGRDAREVGSVQYSRAGRDVTARISFTDGRMVLRAGTLPKTC
jgi:N-acetylglucosamine-6-sulfatase